MAFIFDHMIAFLVGTTLLVALLFVQQRGRQTAAETSIRYRAEVQAASFVEVLSRDLENARTRQQARSALGIYERDDLGGDRERAIGIHRAGGQVDWIEFVTLEDPDAGPGSALLPIAYKLEPLDPPRLVDANGQSRALHRVTRYVYDGSSWVADGASPETVVGFDVSVPGASAPSSPVWRIRELPRQLEFALEFAYETPQQVAGDQAETAQFGLTRQGATVRLYASGTGGRALPPRQSGPAEIPAPPWAPEYVPPPPTGGGPGDGGDTDRDADSGGGDRPPPRERPPVRRPSGREV